MDMGGHDSERRNAEMIVREFVTNAKRHNQLNRSRLRYWYPGPPWCVGYMGDSAGRIYFAGQLKSQKLPPPQNFSLNITVPDVKQVGVVAFTSTLTTLL